MIQNGEEANNNVELYLSSMFLENSNSQKTYPLFVLQEMAYCKESPFSLDLEKTGGRILVYDKIRHRL